LFNPTEGFVATANHKMIPEHYPYNVGFEWAPPYRVTRIRSVLEQAKQVQHKLAIADMESLQNDVTSLPALDFQKLISTTSLKGDPDVRSFLSWDGRLTRESTDAALYEVWFEKLCAGTSDLFSKGRDLRLPKLSGRYDDLTPDVVLRILASPDNDLFGNNPLASRDQLLADTLKAARHELTKLLGTDASLQTWGKLHMVRFRHALDQQPGAQGLFDLGPLARPGDEYTVNATGTGSSSWDQVSGASYREILDTADWDRSVAINTPGQSGQPGSPHYSDLMPLWDAGQYFPLLYSRKAVENGIVDRLVLEP
jgi:penicillin amidase